MTRVKKIMIGDDDLSIIDVLTLMLETAGYEVYSSANEKIIEDVERVQPDLILLDILMLGINGEDICKQLKTGKTTKHLPVIIISANKDAKVIAKACADGFIAKPFEMNKMLKTVAKYIQK